MSPSRSLKLHIDFVGYWHAGSGRGAGHHLDAVCEKNAEGLPVVPGKHLKGLLRQAVARAEAWGWFKDFPLPEGPMSSHETLLFGSDSQTENRFQTQPGMLLVQNAELPEAERSWLSEPEQSGLRQALFSELFSTAIDENSRTAKHGSLRGIEVCLPVLLEAGLTLQVTALDPELRQQQQSWLAQADAWQPLHDAASLIEAVGAHRNRGLGEAQLRFSPESKGVGA